MCVACQGPAIGLKFLDIASLSSGAVNPKILAEMDAVRPLVQK